MGVMDVMVVVTSPYGKYFSKVLRVARWVPQEYCKCQPTAAETEAKDSGIIAALRDPSECVEDS